MKVRLIIVMLTCLLSTHVFAKCEKGNEIIFSCKVKKSGKYIEVCDAKTKITYSFGKSHKKPELSLAIPRNEASTYQWSGIGRYYSYSVFIPNGKVVYEVFWKADRMTDEHEIKAGVSVQKNDEVIATIYCINKTIINNIEGVALKPN